jgi:hypothetical protein
MGKDPTIGKNFGILLFKEAILEGSVSFALSY